MKNNLLILKNYVILLIGKESDYQIKDLVHFFP
jgi:hypothetical protein